MLLLVETFFKVRVGRDNLRQVRTSSMRTSICLSVYNICLADLRKGIQSVPVANYLFFLNIPSVSFRRDWLKSANLILGFIKKNYLTVFQYYLISYRLYR